MKFNFLLLLPFSIAVILFAACKKDSGDNAMLRIRLTDAPAAFDEVNIDLEQVNIKFANDSSSWHSMKTNPGIYNLLALQNGVDTLIAEGLFPYGRIKEIRLVLGENNTIKAGGQTYPLTIPSGSESGLKIKLDKSLSTPLDSLIVDFDAFLSVKPEADGYKLRPVLKIK